MISHSLDAFSSDTPFLDPNSLSLLSPSMSLSIISIKIGPQNIHSLLRNSSIWLRQSLMIFNCVSEAYLGISVLNYNSFYIYMFTGTPPFKLIDCVKKSVIPEPKLDNKDLSSPYWLLTA